MVAVIKTGHSIHRIINYNENKVKEGVAECISAVGYPMDVDKMSLTVKLNRLLKQAALNENVKRNSVHISLNFDPSEQLSKDQLQDIAATYMNGIGFREQPYLVYRHFDAGHPHIHIVSIKVKADGSRIDMQSIGRNQSETARKAIEQQFGLKKPEDSHPEEAYTLQPVSAQKVQYGRTATKRAITNVLDAVLQQYKYTSLPELNAVLGQYNVLADRGTENSRVFQKGGLIYRVLDEQGYVVGVPIKASDFHTKPTLKVLERRFLENEISRQPHKGRVKNAIDLAFLRHPNMRVAELLQALDKEGIRAILRQNKEGVVYGLTYVDHRTKCVFNGSVLGKAYSAKGVLDRSVAPATQDRPKQIAQPMEKTGDIRQSAEEKDNLLDTLLQPGQPSGYVPFELTGKGRKKKKKRISKRL